MLAGAVGPVRQIAAVAGQCLAEPRIRVAVARRGQSGRHAAGDTGQQDVFADLRGRAAVVRQPVGPGKAGRAALCRPVCRGQEQAAPAGILVMQWQDQRAEHEIEQPHRPGDFAHQQAAAGFQQRAQVRQGAADVLGGVDDIGGDDQIVVAGSEALGAGVLLQIEAAIVDKGVVAEFLPGAAQEDRRDIGKVIMQCRLPGQFRQQPGRGASGAAADLQYPERLRRPAVGLPFPHQAGHHASGNLVEVAAEAEFLIQHLDAARCAVGENHRHRFELTAHHRVQAVARPGQGVGNDIQSFAVAAQFQQQRVTPGVGNRLRRQVALAVTAVIAILDAGIEQADQQLPVAGQQPSAAQDAGGGHPVRKGVADAALHQGIDVDGMQQGHAVIQRLQPWQIQAGGGVSGDAAAGGEGRVVGRAGSGFCRFGFAPVARAVERIAGGMHLAASRGQQGLPWQTDPGGIQLPQRQSAQGRCRLLPPCAGDPVGAIRSFAPADPGQRCIGPEFQAHADAVVQCAAHRLVMAHRLAQMPAPVIRFIQPVGIHHRAEQGGDQRQSAGRSVERGGRVLVGIQNRVEQGRVGRAGHAQPLMADLPRVEDGGQRVDGIAQTGEHQMARAIAHGQIQPQFPGQRQQCRLVGEHGQHGPAGTLLHQGAAALHQRHDLLDAVVTGDYRRRIFAHRVTEHHVRFETQRLPVGGHGQPEGDDGRLGVVHAFQQGAVLAGHDFAQGRIERHIAGGKAAFEAGGKGGRALGHGPAHAGPVRSLAGEQPELPAGDAVTGLQQDVALAGGMGVQRGSGFLAQRHGQPESQVQLSPVQRGMCQVAGRGVAHGCGMGGSQSSQGAVAGRTQQQRALAAGCVVTRSVGAQCLGEGGHDHVAVGAADAERGHAGQTFGTGPWRGGGWHMERTGFQGQCRVGLAEMQAGRNHPAFHRQYHLDQAGNAGRRVQVAEVALDRAQRAARAAMATGKGTAQRFQFDRIAERGCGAVRLDQTDLHAVDPGEHQGFADHLALAGHRRRGIADLAVAVVVDCAAAQHGHDRIAVAQRVAQPAQGHHTDAIAGEGALCPGIERPAVTVRRENHARLVEITGLLRKGECHAAGDGHVAFAGAQAFAGQMYGDQRAGAGGLHRQRRAAEIQLVGDAGGEVILVVAHQRLQPPDLCHLGNAQRFAARIGTDPCRAEHAGLVRHVPWCVAGVFQCMPGGLQEQPLLRVHRLGLLPRVREQRGIEGIGLVEHGADIDEIRRVDGGGIQPGVEQRLARKAAAALAPVEQVLPESLAVGRLREAAGEADDGNRFAVRVVLLQQGLDIRGRAGDGKGVSHVGHPEGEEWRKWCGEAGGTAGWPATG